MHLISLIHRLWEQQFVTLYINKTFNSLWKNKGNGDAGWLFLASLDQLTKVRNELCDKINSLPASQNTVQENNDARDKIDSLQMHMNSLKTSKRIFSPATTELKLQKMKLRLSL